MKRTGRLLLRRCQRGVSIITAIFLLLFFAGLAALMANMMSTAHTTAALDVLGARAYQAARGGAEWGLYQVMQPDAAVVSATAALPTCFLPSPAVVAGMGATVSVNCEVFPPATASPDFFEEGSRRFKIYRIASTATIPGPGVIVERRVEVTVEKCRDTASTVAPFEC